MYGLCRVPEPGSGTPRIVLISWVSAGAQLGGTPGWDPPG